jgi:hypothetical protein
MKKILLKLTVPAAFIALAALGCSNPSGGGSQPGGGGGGGEGSTTYTVTFDSRGGSEVESQDVEAGGTVTLPLDPASVDNNVFGGWYKESTPVTPWRCGVDTVTDDITLYAKWLTQTEANTEDFGGGAVEWTKTVTNKTAWDSALSDISGGSNGKNYVIIMNSDIDGLTGLGSSARSFGNVTGITVSLRGSGSLALGSDGDLITVNANQTLILRGPALKGKADNPGNVVYVYDSTAEFIMKSGSVSGNSTINNYAGGGVYVVGGPFTMSGGTISGNSVPNGGHGGGVAAGNASTFTLSGGTISGNSITGDNGGGGGVAAAYGTFDMTGGIISGNSVTGPYNYGGGVYTNEVIFTMSGGAISGNSITGNGGGVYVYASYMGTTTFTMSGGTIGGNSATVNSGYGYSGGGGGVYVESDTDTTFTKTGGTIYGSNAGAPNWNRASGNGKGHAVYKYITVNTGKYRDTTAGPEVNINTSTDVGLQ